MPVGLDAILTRISQISQPPAAIAQIQSRFASMMDEGNAAVTGSTSSESTQTSSTTTAAVRTEAVGTMAPATIARGVGAASSANTDIAGAAGGSTATAMPTGVWVDRIPSAKGKALAPTIAAAAAKYNMDPAFLSAVFWTESSYTPDAVSRTGAIGLGQLMPETAQWLGVNPWDATQNIDGTAKFYRYLLDKNNGDITLAIASYAAGPGAVKKAGGVPDTFTQNYITKLLARRDYLAGARATAP